MVKIKQIKISYKSLAWASKRHEENARQVIVELLEKADFPNRNKRMAYPTLVFGKNSLEAVNEAEIQANGAKDKVGRKYPKNGKIAIYGWILYPLESNNIKPQDHDFQKWITTSVNFLKQHYQNQLVSVCIMVIGHTISLRYILIPNSKDERLEFHPTLNNGLPLNLCRKKLKYEYYSYLKNTL